MKILGIDPGTARIGWALLDVVKNNPTHIAYGLIETNKEELPENRLKKIYDAIISIIEKYNPEILCIEELFFSTNAKTAIAVGQARGIVLLAAAQYKIKISSFSPLAVKRTITGDGRADKKQVERMVIRSLHLKNAPQSDDTADAIAIALTYAYTKKFK